LQDVSSPWSWAAITATAAADELCSTTYTASAEGRALFTDILREVAAQIFIPLTVGAASNTLDDFDGCSNAARTM
jgi:cyclase